MSIDISLVIWTIICFFALYFVLKYLWFKPIISFMDARKARIEAGLEAGSKATQLSAENARLMDEAVKAANEQAKELVIKSRLRDEQKRAAAVRQAHLDAEARIKEIDEKLRLCQEEETARLKGEMPELVSIITGTLPKDREAAAGCKDLVENAVFAGKAQ